MKHVEYPDKQAIQKILVVGAGAVGGYFGARLFRSGADLRFLLRPESYKHIKKNGLEIRSPDGDFLIRPPMIQHPADCPPVDLIILAVKCYDLKAVLSSLQGLINKGAILLTLQNGITAEDEILSAYPGAALLAGVAFITAKRLAAGVIAHAANGMIALGEWSGEPSLRARAVHELFSNAGIDCFLKSSIRQTKWEKLCWNATFNPLSVLLDHPVSLILDSEALLDIVREGIREIIQLAAAEGIVLHPKIIDSTISVTASLRAYYTSMYEDYRHGRPTEIEYLNGELMRRGKKHGIPTPTHTLLYRLIKGLELKRRLGGNLN